MRIVMLALLYFIILFLSVGEAPAQQTFCGRRSDIIERLDRKYNEVPVAVGIASDGGLIEVLVSEGGETWTIIHSYPDGRACLAGSGEGWRNITPERGSKI